MERKPGGEDDCVDSGAETGGSEYSRMSSTSSELSVEDNQDPFLVSIHIIADPGESKVLQQAIDKLLAWIHPDLQLFRVSERRVSRKHRKSGKAAVSQPALAVILFLQEEYGEEPILQLHETFQRPPWHYHHTERVQGKFLPYMPCSQDFFTLAHGTPLWAIRPVHYGREIIRFAIYCRNENFIDIMKLYQLILKRPVCQKKADFCVFPVYSNMDIDIQFSLKRLPKGQIPTPTESAVLEFRVEDVGQLVPLLPNPCSPISEGRWQTEDHDGNKILLQVEISFLLSTCKTLTSSPGFFSSDQARIWYRKSAKQNKLHFPSSRDSHFTPSPSYISHSHRPAPDQTSEHLNSAGQIKLHRANGLGQYLGISQQDLRNGDRGDFTRRSSSASSISWSFQRSKSLFCLPTTSSSPASDSFNFSEPFQNLNTGSSVNRLKTWRCSPKLNIENLEGSQETDVDTGMKLSFSDLSVVSAYSTFNGFCSDLEAALPSQRQSVSISKQAVSRGRPLSAMCSTLELPSGSLPSLSEWSSSSFLSSSASPLASHCQLRQSPGATPCSLNDRKTTGSIHPGSPTNEEEFYI
ncbi:protein FAM124A isoform X4 [Trachemys scripta elegans]|uniref:protein FAM124A isoform X4 n=2 Tax=Trachemys scripta elegans TaxID=31138 RepID=UPI0015548154|nr:protein FAM124A isoform X4 [Trachemys scripta elegans]